MRPVEPPAPRLGCADCGLHAICLPEGVDEAGLARLDRLTRQRSTYERGEVVFRQGQSFNTLYVVRSGAIRVAIRDAGGGQQVLGFRLPGEILGVDALLDNAHRTNATALERVARFLNALLVRYDRLSRPTDLIRLPMARGDIACYLGLAVETVSRAFGRLEENGIMVASGRHVRIFRRDLLEALCTGTGNGSGNGDGARRRR
jgi:CRP/FNR family transcriptional regulator, anaerobic regulatory protein